MKPNLRDLVNGNKNKKLYELLTRGHLILHGFMHVMTFKYTTNYNEDMNYTLPFTSDVLEAYGLSRCNEFAELGGYNVHTRRNGMSDLCQLS